MQGMEFPGWKSTSAVLVLNAKPLFFPHFLSPELLLIQTPAVPQGGAVEAGEVPAPRGVMAQEGPAPDILLRARPVSSGDLGFH